MTKSKKSELEAAALLRIQDAHKLLQETKVQATKARNEAKTVAEASEAHLKSQVEMGLPPDAEAAAVAVKLQNIELAWQNFEEAKAAGKELRKLARESTAQARQALADAVSDSKQLTLPLTAPQDASS